MDEIYMTQNSKLFDGVELEATPIMIAANLIGVITSMAALDDARQDFGRWLGTVHSCMLYHLRMSHDQEVNDDTDADHRQPGHP